MELTTCIELLERYGQQHMMHYYDKLSESQREKLIASIAEIDFTAFKNIAKKEERGEITPAEALSLKQIKKRRTEFELAGLAAIRAGKVGVVLLAGGQGTRLEADGPKGAYDIGENRELSLFQCQIESLARVCAKAGVTVPLFIMTSALNDVQTKKFFDSHNYFGYDPEMIHFYVQSEAPAISFDGKILMEEKYKPVMAPNGNGGWYNSLMKAGYGRLLKKYGIEWLNVVGVDNVLQKICEPAFIGATLLSGVACGSKVVKKVSPDEKVGVLCLEDGLPTVLEYYDMPQKLKIRRDLKGELIYGYGVILNYLFNVEKLKEISRKKLPYHLAEKKINCIKGGKKFVPEEPNGYKLEQLAVDMVKLSATCIGYEVEREKEFAPVKNRTGADSVDSARALLKLNGIKI